MTPYEGERTPENLENILIQFNKIAPELNILEADIQLKEIMINAI